MAQYYVAPEEVFLDIVAGMESTAYFACSDLNSGKIQMKKANQKFPVIFMIRPSGYSKTGTRDMTTAYQDINIDFILFDRYKRIDNESEYAEDSFDTRILHDVVKSVGTVFEEFQLKTERSVHIIGEPKFSNINNQIPLSILLRDNETKKTSTLFDGHYAGIFCSLTCNIKQYFTGCDGGLNPDIWLDSEFWDDTEIDL